MGDGHTAIIEMARTSGLALVPIEPVDRRNPLRATTFGLGEAIKAALDEGYRRFIVGIGGSATNDGGAGMAQALGVRLRDSQGIELPFGGAALIDLVSIDLSGLDSRLSECEIMVACDVNNPLTGPEGASAIFGPQKGATPDMVEQLDEALLNFATIVKQDTGAEINDMMGAGAAGGLGGGMVAFLGAELAPGVDIVLDTIEFDRHLEGADLVLTGEGALDSQTIYNKAPIGVARRAGKLGIPVIAIAGTLGENYQVVHDHGISAAVAIPNGPMTLEAASAQAAYLITDSTRQVIRMLKVGGQLFSR
jgi:glycerate kinase